MAERIEADLQEKINCYFSNTRNIFLDKLKQKTYLLASQFPLF